MQNLDENFLSEADIEKLKKEKLKKQLKKKTDRDRKKFEFLINYLNEKTVRDRKQFIADFFQNIGNHEKFFREKVINLLKF